jgi:2,5-diketo-D-gluconate reductase A
LPTLYGRDDVSTWATLTELVAEGLIRSAGVSNFQPAHLERLVTETGIAPIVNQVELRPYFANHPVQEACRRHGLALDAHSPLGHNREPVTDDTIGRIAEARQVASPGDLPLPHAARPNRHPEVDPAERMAENISVFDLELSREHMRLVDALDGGPGRRVGPNPDIYEG